MQKYQLNIVQDICVESPLDNTEWKMVSFSPKHAGYEDWENYLKPMDKHGEVRATCIGFQKKLDSSTAFILSCYQHSDISWSLKGEGPQCRWDTSRVAGLLIYEGALKDLPKDREACARNILETFTQWCNGQVYGFTLELDGEEVDSCYGFYDEASMIHHIIQNFEGTDQMLEIAGEAEHFLQIEDIKDACHKRNKEKVCEGA